jgi:hypothetical protein
MRRRLEWGVLWAGFALVVAGACSDSTGGRAGDPVADAGGPDAEGVAPRDGGGDDLGGLSDTARPPPDTGGVNVDGAPPDLGAGDDAEVADAAVTDAAVPDAAVPDAADPDAAVPDAADPDAAVPDAAAPDAVMPDAAVPDAADPDAAVSDAAVVDAAAPDAALPPGPPDDVLPANACARTSPALLGERLIVARTDGLYLTDPPLPGPGGPGNAPRLVFPFEAGATPYAPVATDDGAPGPALLATVRYADRCVLHLLDRDGAPLAEVIARPEPGRAPACVEPVVGDALVVWPSRTADGDVLLLLDRTLGVERGTLPLPAGPTAGPIAVLGDPAMANSGSHWLVGATDQLVPFRFELDPATAQVGEGLRVDGLVTTLSKIDTGRVVATLRAVGDPSDALGDRLFRLATAPDGDGPARLAPLEATPNGLAAPGGMFAPPVVLSACDGFVANSGSHWYCPGGAMLTGGDGWLAAIDLGTGEVRAQLDTGPFRTTGLALGADDLLYNSGSHWRPGGEDWQVARWDIGLTLARGALPDAFRVLDLGRKAGGACLPSPVVGSTGAVVTPVDGAPGAAAGPLEVSNVVSTAGTLGPGWARAHGSNAGLGLPTPNAPACASNQHVLEQGAPRTLRDARIVAASPRADGRSVLLGQTTGGNAGDPFVTATKATVDLDWVTSLPDPNSEPALGGALTTVPTLETAVALALDVNGLYTIRFVVLDVAGRVLVDQPLVAPEGRVPVALVPRPASNAGYLLLYRVFDDQGVFARYGVWALDPAGNTLADGEVRGPASTQFVGLVSGGRAAYLLGRTALVPFGIGGYVSRLDALGGQGDSVDLNAFGENWEIISAAERSNPADLVVVFETITAGPTRNLLVIALDDLFAERLRTFVPNGAPLAVAQDKGTLWVLSRNFEVTRLSRDGLAVQATRTYFDGEPTRAPTALVAHPDGGAFAFGTVESAPGFTQTVAVRTDPWLNATCPDAGECLFVAANACTSDACNVATCDPTDGGCDRVPMADGTPCGSALVCAGGVCN